MELLSGRGRRLVGLVPLLLVAASCTAPSSPVGSSQEAAASGSEVRGVVALRDGPVELGGVPPEPSDAIDPMVIDPDASPAPGPTDAMYPAAFVAGRSFFEIGGPLRPAAPMDAGLSSPPRSPVLAASQSPAGPALPEETGTGPSLPVVIAAIAAIGLSLAVWVLRTARRR